MACHYNNIYDFNKAIVSYELALSIARENNDLVLEYDAVYLLGRNYTSLGDFGNAMKYFDRVWQMHLHAGILLNKESVILV